MSERLSYIRLLVSDFEKSFGFYNKILDLNLKFGNKDSTYCEFETGSTDIAIFKRKEMEKQTGLTLPATSSIQSNVIIIIEVDNVDAYQVQLKEAGVEILTPPTERKEWDVKTMHIQDPDGNLIEINSRLDD